MRIIFKNTLAIIDPCVCRAFAQVLNILLLSSDPGDLDMNLNRCPGSHEYRAIGRYFKWYWTGYRFTLYQRIEYGSMQYFEDPVLTVSFSEIEMNIINKKLNKVKS